MNAANLCLDTEYIFLDPYTKAVKCIFWPIVNNENAVNPVLFLSEFPYKLVFNKHEDNSYVGDYMQFFKSSSSLSTNAIERFVLQLAGKSVNKNHTPSSDISKNHNEQRNTASGDTGKIAYDPLRQNRNNRNEPNKNNICKSCNNSNSASSKFCNSCGETLNSSEYRPDYGANEEERSAGGTTVLGVSSPGTTVLGEYSGNDTVYPFLLRERNKEKIFVDKPCFRIGKEKQYTDFFISGNTAISRGHADIITRNGQYFILDHNSTNKTRVDGRIIPPKQEYEIFPGTKLRLADEDFEFNI
jgi:hypothetical protein